MGGKPLGRISRASIIEGAKTILEAGVYGDLTVDSLALKLQMSKSTLYKYFPGKNDVVASLIDEACAAVDQALAATVDREGDPIDTIKALVDTYAKFTDELPRAILLHRRRLPAYSQDRLELTRVRLTQACRAVAQRAANNGGLSGHDPALVAETLVAAADAAVASSARGEIRAGRGEAVRGVFALLLPGLQLPPVV